MIKRGNDDLSLGETLTTREVTSAEVTKTEKVHQTPIPNAEIVTKVDVTPTNPHSDPTTPESATKLLIPNPVGIGLNENTEQIVEKYKNCHGLVSSPNIIMAKNNFPNLDGWIRVIMAPSLEGLLNIAERAKQEGIEYEAIGYGLETGKSTPDEEWQNLNLSVQKARSIGEQFDKLLLFGPGFRLMSQNEEEYSSLAGLTDIWMIQTQRLQKDPPGNDYRKHVEEVINQIRENNPNVSIWAQITLPPDREPDAEEWLAYRNSTIDLVDGTYIGVYTWDTVENAKLLSVLEAILSNVCMN